MIMNMHLLFFFEVIQSANVKVCVFGGKNGQTLIKWSDFTIHFMFGDVLLLLSIHMKN